MPRGKTFPNFYPQAADISVFKDGDGDAHISLTLLAKAGKALEDAERYAHIKVQFSPMSLDINGQHSWMWRGDPSSLKGPNIDVAVDAARKGGT